MRKLIVNADDFGMTRGINKGVLRAFQQGILTSATALVNLPCWEHAAGLVNKNPSLGIGLHFNLTLGSPITDPQQIPSLAKDGVFMEDSELLAAADPGEIKRELVNQYHRLERSGIKPTHVDSHQNIHSIDTVLAVILQFACGQGIPVRLIPQARTRYASAGAWTTGALIDQFRGRGASRPNFERLLSSCTSETVEFQCHPGTVDADLELLSSYTWQRERELAVICGYAKEDFSARYGYALVAFSGLQDPA